VHDLQDDVYDLFLRFLGIEIQLDEFLSSILVHIQVWSGSDVNFAMNVSGARVFQYSELIVLKMLHVSLDCADVVFNPARVFVWIFGSLLFQVLLQRQAAP